MSTPTTIARTAPIAIAAKPTKPKIEASGKENTKLKVSASMSSIAGGEASNIRSRKERPCDACRKRKSRCVMHEGQTACVLCQFHSQDCTFVQSPQPRKRKLNGDGKEGSAAKRRYALSSPDTPTPTPPSRTPHDR
jgi:Fungal Zn(2)-Cys(6) binuclear cluster domain